MCAWCLSYQPASFFPLLLVFHLRESLLAQAHVPVVCMCVCLVVRLPYGCRMVAVWLPTSSVPCHPPASRVMPCRAVVPRHPGNPSTARGPGLRSGDSFGGAIPANPHRQFPGDQPWFQEGAAAPAASSAALRARRGQHIKSENLAKQTESRFSHSWKVKPRGAPAAPAGCVESKACATDVVASAADAGGNADGSDSDATSGSGGGNASGDGSGGGTTFETDTLEGAKVTRPKQHAGLDTHKVPPNVTVTRSGRRLYKGRTAAQIARRQQRIQQMKQLRAKKKQEKRLTGKTAQQDLDGPGHNGDGSLHDMIAAGTLGQRDARGIRGSSQPSTHTASAPAGRSVQQQQQQQQQQQRQQRQYSSTGEFLRDVNLEQCVWLWA